MQHFATFQTPHDLNWSLSPDGLQVAMIWVGSVPGVTFMTVKDKSTREVTLTQWAALQGGDWLADGKGVMVAATAKNGASVMLAVTGERRLLLEGGRSVRFWWALPSPDGHYAALEELTGENNIWMIENFSGHGFVAPVSTRFDMGPFNSGYILPTKCITTFSLVEKSPMRISSAAVLESALTVIGVLPAHFQCHLAGCKVSGMEDPGPGSSPW